MTKLLILIIAVSIFTACGHSAEQSEAVVVRGQLFSAATRKPLSNFEVTVADLRPRRSWFGVPGPIPLGKTKSDSSGRFAVTITDAKRYDKAAKAGQLGLLLLGDQPVMGIVGLKSGKAPVYYVDPMPAGSLGGQVF